MSLVRFFKLKTAALFHDPPHKPWVLFRPIKHKGHEEEAKKLLEQVVRATILKGSEQFIGREPVSQVDRMASSVERYILSLLLSNWKPGALPVREIKLKNILSPHLEVKLDQCLDDNRLEEFKRELSNILKQVDELSKNLAEDERARLLYTVLHIILEPLWVSSGLPLGPGDTRVPTHTVFDHNYACATFMNWFVGGDRPSGYLVSIDVAGVHRFIESSRKLVDLWASSYLVSLLSWYSIREFLVKLGPDVLILPSPRFNPFLYHTMLVELKRLNQKTEDLINKLSEIIKEGTGGLYDPLKPGFPMHAYVPGRLLLVLPSGQYIKDIVKDELKSCRDMKHAIACYIQNRFREGWRKLYEVLEEAFSEEGVERLIKKLLEKSGVIGGQESRAYKWGFAKEPPISVRVIVIDVREAYETMSEDKRRFLYDSLMVLLSKKEALLKLTRIEPEAYLSFAELRDRYRKGNGLGLPKQSSRSFEYCTVCGRLPAFIVMPSGEDEYEKEIKKLAEEDEELQKIVNDLKPWLSEGERLCPWCVLKRFFGFKLDKFLSKLDFEPLKRIEGLSFPSTSDIASIEFKEALIKSEKLDGILKDIEGRINEYGIVPRKEPMRRASIWPKLNELIRKVDEKVCDEERAIILKWLIIECSELTYFGTKEVRTRWSELIRKHRLTPPRIYVTLIEADGDSLGKVLRGELSEAPMDIDPVEWLREACEGRLADVIKVMLNGDIERAKEIIVREEKLLDEKDFEKFCEGMRKLIQEYIRREEKPRIVITPAYHVSVSAGLMRAALLDSNIINDLGGVIIYTGGDDMLAMLPTSKALMAVYDTRRAFSGSKIKRQVKDALLCDGFLRIKEAYYPMLSPIGRSYSVYIFHYHYPMSVVLRAAHEMVEHAKGKALWKHYCRSLKKDMLIVAYNPRGKEVSAHIPLTPDRPICRNLDQIGKLVEYCDKLVKELEEDEGSLSISFLYDYAGVAELLDKILKEGDKKVLLKFIEELINRNVRSKREMVFRRKEYMKMLLLRAVEQLITLRCLEDAGYTFFLTHLVTISRLIRSGMRGGPA